VQRFPRPHASAVDAVNDPSRQFPSAYVALARSPSHHGRRRRPVRRRDGWGFPHHDEDLGQTFGAWGVGDYPYLMLPVSARRSPRDAIGLAATSISTR